MPIVTTRERQETIQTAFPTLTLTLKTLPSANNKTRFGKTRKGEPIVYNRKDIAEAQTEAIKSVDEQVARANWTIDESDLYHVTYQLGMKSWLSADFDNLLKLTNDCLGRTRNRKKRKGETMVTKILVCGNALWDDRRIISGAFAKIPGRTETILTIQKVQSAHLFFL